jgi:conserved oligomeric Golgi complex subunit 3
VCKHANINNSLYRDQLALSERHLDNLLKDTSSSLDILASLSDAFKSVEAQTMAFQAQCEGLLEEQKRLKLLSDEVEADLKCYSYLEPITRRLNAPGASSILGDDGFFEILMNLDISIEFMIEHVCLPTPLHYLARIVTCLAW